MEALLGELGRRIADRWLVQLVLPGLLWLAAAVTALTLGHAHALDGGRLLRRADLAAMAVPARPVPIAVTIAAALALAALAGLAAQAAARALQSIWVGQWRPPAAALGARLTARRAGDARARYARPPFPERYLPARPTWIGDRLRLAGERVDAQYGLRLPVIWTALWQVMDDAARAPVRDARDDFDQALRLAAWGVLHTAVGLAWWPGLLAGALTFAVAWRRGRDAAATLADVVEATVDTHHRALAEALGVALPHGRLTPAESASINDLLHKGHSRP
ncbi:hypothetical protein ABGB17_10940 [Sphaerisporangium sp. B11E5]|uniref:hypothetical protein n=1 Tax=Sphaerisporangium sp. B11E5 TaxID=3153563 RepID=UPI00325F3C17